MSNKTLNNIPFSESAFYAWSGTLFGKIVLHTSFWILFYIYLFSDLLSSVSDGCDFKCMLSDNTLYLLCTMAAVYINAYFFVPSFLYTRRFLLYIISLISVVISVAGIKLFFYNYVLEAKEVESEGLFTTLVYWFMRDLFEVSAISSIKIARDWILTAAQLRQKEKNEMEAEFRFLKAQVNPHFIFNTLNNIYFLTQKNPAKAGESVISLSNILRYRIYEPGGNNTINNEILCIKELIELERLRMGDDVLLELNTEQVHENPVIEPLLFIPFVENAFKHFRPCATGKWIKINFITTKEYVEFTCSNSFVSLPEDKNKQPGIGIKNVVSRLKLIYPASHTLTLSENTDSYSVYLKILL